MIDDPAAIPVTTPLLLIVAVGVLLLVHEPNKVASLSEVVLPTQTDVVPVMAAGVVFDVNVAVAAHPPLIA